MASADGGEQTPGGGELVVPDGAQVPGGGQQMPHDGNQQEQQEPGAGGLAEPDGQQVQGGGEPIPQESQVAVLASQVAILMPPHITIGTAKAYEKNRPYNYTKRQVRGETIYVCDKGSEWSRPHEYLVLRREQGIWIAYDGAVSPDGGYLICRHAVWKCDTDITQAGWHDWQTNWAATRSDPGFDEQWYGTLQAETRVQ